MISPRVNQFERRAAQLWPVAHGRLSQAANPVMLYQSADVPSCFYPADTHKTCYPSPIRRSASPGWPPFFCRRAGLGGARPEFTQKRKVATGLRARTLGYGIGGCLAQKEGTRDV